MQVPEISEPYFTVDNILSEAKKAWHYIAEKAKTVALLLLGAFLFYSNSGFFFMGAVLGLTAQEKVLEVTNTIKMIANRLPWETLAIVGIAFSAGYPFFTAISALYYGAWGTIELINKAKARENPL